MEIAGSRAEALTGCPICGDLMPVGADVCRGCSGSLAPVPAGSMPADRSAVNALLGGVVDRFTLSYLAGAELRGACLSEADLFGAQLVSADLRGADLGCANLSGADLRAADLSGANLRGADLSDAMLDGADLRRADLTDADLEGTTFDGRTTWPDGYDAAAAGAIDLSRE